MNKACRIRLISMFQSPLWRFELSINFNTGTILIVNESLTFPFEHLFSLCKALSMKIKFFPTEPYPTSIDRDLGHEIVLSRERNNTMTKRKRVRVLGRRRESLTDKCKIKNLEPNKQMQVESVPLWTMQFEKKHQSYDKNKTKA